MSQTSSVIIAIIGEAPLKVWGLSQHERLTRIAAKAGYQLGTEPVAAGSDAVQIIVNGRYCFDPLWLTEMRNHGPRILTLDSVPVLAIVETPAAYAAVTAAMQADAPLAAAAGLPAVIAYEDVPPTIFNQALRKRERPFLMRVTRDSIPAIERASYFGAYKGVTDILTKYLWPELALWLTRLAARIGMTPNMVTAIGGTLCLVALWFFATGQYWTGIACGFGFMVLDTVDGKLARCTITSSYWGNFFDHGIDLIHPPFWWYAWGLGLAAHGLPLSDALFFWVMVAIVAGYVLQRLIEGWYIGKLGLDMHIWQPFDSRFRLITARRNPNMVILVAALLAGRPDIGLLAVAVWTVLSLVVHAVRLAQATATKARDGKITSWMVEPA